MIAKYTRQFFIISNAFIFACTGPAPVTPGSSEDRTPTTTAPGIRVALAPLAAIGVTFVVNLNTNRKADKRERPVVQKDSIPQTPFTLDMPSAPDTTSLFMSMAELQNEIAPMVQEFEVSAGQDNIITCENGTKVFLPSGIFNAQSDSIHVTVREYYSKADYISANLSTVSDGRILESGGTVKITAEENGKPLDVKDGESFLVLFPKTTGGEMETFYGQQDNDSIVTWTQARTVEPKDRFDDDGFEHRYYVKDERTYPSSDEWRFLDEEEKRNIYQYFYEEYNGFSTGAVNYSNGVFSGKDFEGMQQQFCYKVLFDQSGIVSELIMNYGHKGNIPVEVDSAVSSFLFTMPPVDLGTVHPHNYEANSTRIVYGEDLCFYIKTHLDKERYQESLRARYADNKENVIEKIPSAELDYFILSSTELGWINCDRFLDTRAKPTALSVDGGGMQNAKYYLIFENFNGVMAGYDRAGEGYTFDAALLHEPAKLLAISFIGYQPYLASKNITIGKDPVTLDNFKPFTIDDLDAALK